MRDAEPEWICACKVMTRLFIVSGLVLIVTQGLSWGCTCLGTNHPCAEFNKGSAVFIGHVIEDQQSKEKGAVNRAAQKVIVDEEFRGVKKGQVIEIAEFGFCNTLLASGVTYLVYADKHENGMYSVFMCSRTRPLSNAQGDIEFLRNLNNVKQASAHERIKARSLPHRQGL